MLINLPAPVIGALVSSAVAVAIALFSLTVTHRSKKMDATRDLLRKYFSPDFTLIRRESFPMLRDFWSTHTAGSDNKTHPLIQYLVNSQWHEYAHEKDISANGLSGQENTLILLYFWAELDAYRKRKLLDSDIVREILVAQWDFYRDALKQVVSDYEGAVLDRNLSVPPWVPAIKSTDEWMRVGSAGRS